MRSFKSRAICCNHCALLTAGKSENRDAALCFIEENLNRIKIGRKDQKKQAGAAKKNNLPLNNCYSSAL
jgi:hypothetical protein